MYNDEIETICVSLEQLFLDPNNPRFSTERQSQEIKDPKIVDSAIQKRTLDAIEAYGVSELRNSILRNGFLYLDRIVVRPIEGQGEMYVAVEGNRRLAALKILYDQIIDMCVCEDDINDEYLDKLQKSIEKIEVLLYKGQQRDISWLLQGIRHISGIRPWDPAQRARLVVEQIDLYGNKAFGKVGQMFGLSAKAVGRLYRSYKGLEQMREDEDYGTKAKNEYFSIFDEAYGNTKVRTWLKWDNDLNKFSNIDALKQFYSWIVPDEDHSEKKRRIHNPNHIKYLAMLLEKERNDLIGEIDRHETTIEEAKERAADSPGKYNWQIEIEKAVKVIKGLPYRVFEEQPEELKKSLHELKSLIDRVLNQLDK